MLRVKEVRKRKNLTQDQVALLCEIPKRSYVDYENEKRDIPLSKLFAIAKALGVHMQELLTDTQKESLDLLDRTEANLIIDHVISNKDKFKDEPKMEALIALFGNYLNHNQ